MQELKIKVLEKDEQQKFYCEILEMLYTYDEDFFPPLSARSSTTQSDLSSSQKSDDGILSYFEELKKQRFAVVCDGGRLLSFVSFKENYTNNEISQEDLPNIYLSTLILRAEARGMGLTYKLYKKLFDHYKNTNIFTRTWSTNAAHIKILSKFNFETIKTLKDDRGKGIDTVYFKKAKID